MYDFSKIKLVIWDLDDTFWNGILSEGPVEAIHKHIALVRRLNDCGIVNSICSRNDADPVEAKLKELGIREEFVFPSVNWEPKGQRIRQLITDMQLRPANVLFIDDTPSNLEEARYYSPEIMTMTPDGIPQLYRDAFACDVKDPEHNRLKQYKILEKKHQEKEDFSSNEEFLYSSNIKVEFGKDCAAHLDRLHELVGRTNQLNFTKLRSPKEELQKLFEDPQTECGYVRVSDRFGDYGITGFYALQGEKLIHFCFSCRILGMGIEQYVYNRLGRPELVITGEVISDLSKKELPGWINQENAAERDDALQTAGAKTHSVLIKGPCDLFQIMPYIADRDLIDTEFTYINEKGVTIESTGHTTHIVESCRLTDAQKERVLSEVPFADPGIYDARIFTGGYKLVIISILTDANLGVYRRKDTGERLAFLEGFHPITDPDNWEAYINGKYNCASFRFTEENLREFSKKYEFIGMNTPEQIVENLAYIREHLPKDCMPAVMLGGELYYEKNTFPAYEDRHIVHKQINDAIRTAAPGLGLHLIDVNRYLTDQSCFYDHFNHYIKPVYYKLASEIVDLINSQTGADMKETSKAKMAQVRIKEMLAPLYYKVKGRT